MKRVLVILTCVILNVVKSAISEDEIVLSYVDDLYSCYDIDESGCLEKSEMAALIKAITTGSPCQK